MQVWLILMSLWAPIVVSAGGLSEQAPATKFSYDATESKGKRATPRLHVGDEDSILDSAKRAKLQANARDIRRNFAIAAWAIRKHLDYVATFDFHCRSGDPGLDRDVQYLIEEWSTRGQFDVRGRHRLSKMIRIAEGLATVDGDFGLMKLADGRVQGIEGDRVRNPPGMSSTSNEWKHGVRCNQAGAAVSYAIHRRKGTGSFEYEREVPAKNFLLHGYFDRYDQIRGISPLAAALNPLRDVYENVDYALAKAKVTQMLAVVMFRHALDSAGEVSNSGTNGTEKNAYNTDFGRGPVQFDLEVGEDAKFLESQQPSNQFQAFTQLVIMIALKALDIPYSFYDESHTNFFGSRAAWLHYERSSKEKRDNVEETLDELTLWRFGLWIGDGTLTLPRGKTLKDINWEWVPTGMPWWDPAKEIRGDLMAVSGGFDNPQRITKERGRGDWYANIDLIKQAMDYAANMGVPISFAPGPEPQVVEVNDGK